MGFDGIVGRDQAVTLRIDDSRVSRGYLHDERGVILSDLDSTNGTLINGKTISRPSPLRDGDVASFGGVSATFRGSNSTEGRRGGASADQHDAEGTTRGSRRDKLVRKSPYNSIIVGGDSRSINLDQQLTNVKDNAGAIRILRPYLRDHPRDSEAMHLLGIAYYESGYFAAAKSVYSTILEREPNDFRAMFGCDVVISDLSARLVHSEWV
jgi:hypothetical protein